MVVTATETALPTLTPETATPTLTATLTVDPGVTPSATPEPTVTPTANLPVPEIIFPLTLTLEAGEVDIYPGDTMTVTWAVADWGSHTAGDYLLSLYLPLGVTPISGTVGIFNPVTQELRTDITQASGILTFAVAESTQGPLVFNGVLTYNADTDGSYLWQRQPLCRILLQWQWSSDNCQSGDKPHAVRWRHNGI